MLSITIKIYVEDERSPHDLALKWLFKRGPSVSKTLNASDMSAVAILAVGLLLLITVHAFSPLRTLRSIKSRAMQKLTAGNSRRVIKTENQERPRKIAVRKLVANTGLLASTVLPGRAVAVQRQPTAIVAETAKQRQNPRDVWTGEKKTEAPEKDDVRLATKAVQKPTVADIKMGTSSFVSAIILFIPTLDLKEQ